MVVIIIVVALGAGGLYGWQRWQQQQRLWQTASQMRDFLERLREDANWHNRDHRLWARREGQAWCLGSDAAKAASCQPGAQWQFLPAWKEIELAEMSSGLAFYGLRSTAWPGHIQLRSPAGSWRIVISVWGRIRLCQPGGSDSCQ